MSKPQPLVCIASSLKKKKSGEFESFLTLCWHSIGSIKGILFFPPNFGLGLLPAASLLEDREMSKQGLFLETTLGNHLNSLWGVGGGGSGWMLESSAFVTSAGFAPDSTLDSDLSRDKEAWVEHHSVLKNMKRTIYLCFPKNTWINCKHSQDHRYCTNPRLLFLRAQMPFCLKTAEGEKWVHKFTPLNRKSCSNGYYSKTN